MSDKKEKLTLTYEGLGEIFEASRVNEDGITIQSAAEFLAVALQGIYPSIADYLKGFKQ